MQCQPTSSSENKIQRPAPSSPPIEIFIPKKRGLSEIPSFYFSKILERTIDHIQEYRAPSANRYSRRRGYWSDPSQEKETNFMRKLTYPRSQRENWYDVTPYIAEFRCAVSNAGFIYVGIEQGSPALFCAGVASAVSHSIPKQWLLTIDKIALIAVILTFVGEYEKIIFDPLILTCAVVAGIINVSDSYLSRMMGKTWAHVAWHLSAAFLARVVLERL